MPPWRDVLSVRTSMKMYFAVWAKVVQIFKDYNATMVAAGRPYRYG